MATNSRNQRTLIFILSFPPNNTTSIWNTRNLLSEQAQTIAINKSAKHKHLHTVSAASYPTSSPARVPPLARPPTQTALPNSRNSKDVPTKLHPVRVRLRAIPQRPRLHGHATPQLRRLQPHSGQQLHLRHPGVRYTQGAPRDWPAACCARSCTCCCYGCFSGALGFLGFLQSTLERTVLAVEAGGKREGMLARLRVKSVETGCDDMQRYP